MALYRSFRANLPTVCMHGMLSVLIIVPLYILPLMVFVITLLSMKHTKNRGLDVIQSHPVCRMCYGQYMHAFVSDSIGQVSNTELEMERNQIH